MRNLEQKEVLKLLNTPTPEFIPLFAPLAVAHIFDLTGGQPFLVQLIAHCVVDRFNRTLEKDDKLEPVFLPADVDKILPTEQFEQFSQPYFHTLRGQLEYIKADSNAMLHIIANHADGITTAELEQKLSAHFGWEKLDDILSFLQTQQIIKLEEEKWQVIGELLRRELRK